MSVPACVIHYDAEGEMTAFVVGGPVRFYCIDERAPHDRVFEMTTRLSPDQLAALIGDSEVGSAQDGRHKAIENRVLAAMEGKPHLKGVK